MMAVHIEVGPFIESKVAAVSVAVDIVHAAV